MSKTNNESGPTNKDQYGGLVARYHQLDYFLPELHETDSGNSKEELSAVRPSFDHVYMAIAEIVSLRSTCLRGKVGAVIVKDTRIVSIGYNGSPSGMAQCDQCGCIIDSVRGGCIRTIHAEQNAIAYASRIGIPIEGATIYVTVSPCIDCAKLIIASGIKRLVYFEEYRNSYALDYLSSSGIETDLLTKGLSEIYNDFYSKGKK